MTPTPPQSSLLSAVGPHPKIDADIMLYMLGASFSQMSHLISKLVTCRDFRSGSLGDMHVALSHDRDRCKDHWMVLCRSHLFAFRLGCTYDGLHYYFPSRWVLDRH